MELGSYAIVWTVLGWLLYALTNWVAGRAKNLQAPVWEPILEFAGLAIMGLGGLQALLLISPVFNPRWHDYDVGATLVFNRLLYVYGVPTLLAIGLTLYFWKRGAKLLMNIAGVGAILLTFILLSLELRQWFHGAILVGALARDSEAVVCSIGWGILGLIFLILGILTRGTMLRWSSLLLMIVSTGKVFLFDISHMPSILRAASLVALAATLLVIAYLYQRFVFKKTPVEEKSQTPVPDAENA